MYRLIQRQKISNLSILFQNKSTLTMGIEVMIEWQPKKKAIENIYWNGKGNAEPTMLDLLFNE